jgi:NTE family protein
MKNSDYIDILKSFSLFKELDGAVLQALIDYAEIETFPAGKDIIVQGEKGDKMYFMIDGIAEAYVIDKSGGNSVIGELKRGSYFGEMSILTNSVRVCSVKTVTPCKTMTLRSHYFYEIANNDLSVLKSINATLSDRLNQTITQLSDNQNQLIIIIYSDDAMKRVNHFNSYFNSIASKEIVMLESNITLPDLTKKLQQCQNTFLIIQSKSYLTNDVVNKAHYIINFVEEQNDQISLLADTTTWKIEHTARVINKKTIGIALCSGGAPGAAHLGVLKILQNEHIGLDYIAGTSAGAFYGGCYTLGYSMDRILSSVVKEIDYSHRFSSYLKNISFSFTGLLKRDILRKFFYKTFGDKKIEDALIPYTAIASDLITGKSVAIKTGSMAEAVLLSGSPPILFEPHVTDDAFLVDGVLTDPLPTQVLVDEQIDIKIAVPIPQLDLTVKMNMNAKMLDIYLRSRSVMAEQLTKISLDQADVIIRPNVSGIHVNDWNTIHRVVEEGERVTHDAVKRIRYLLTRSNKP